MEAVGSSNVWFSSEGCLKCSGVTILRLLGQVESYLSILLLNQDVLIIFPGSKLSLEFGEISVLW